MSVSSNFFRVNFDSSSAGQAAAARAEEEARALADYLEAQAEAEEEDEERELTPQEAIAERFDPDIFDWTNIVTSHVGDSLFAWEKATGQIEGMWKHTFKQYGRQMYSAIQQRFFSPNADTTHFLTVNDVSASQQTQIQEQRINYYQNTSAGIKEVIEFGIQFMGGLMGAQLSPASPKSSGGRGRGGPRGPTDQDIRNKFDIEELTRSVDDLNRMLVFEPNDNSKKIARDYVELVVRGKGEKKIDFENFVRTKIEATSRFKSIYRNKPKALRAEQYMAPFYQQAASVTSGDEAAELAIGGAQFGASAQQFQARLGRTDAVITSAPYVNQIQGRLEELNQVFKG